MPAGSEIWPEAPLDEYSPPLSSPPPLSLAEDSSWYSPEEEIRAGAAGGNAAQSDRTASVRTAGARRRKVFSSPVICIVNAADGGL